MSEFFISEAITNVETKSVDENSKYVYLSNGMEMFRFSIPIKLLSKLINNTKGED